MRQNLRNKLLRRQDQGIVGQLSPAKQAYSCWNNSRLLMVETWAKRHCQELATICRQEWMIRVIGQIIAKWEVKTRILEQILNMTELTWFTTNTCKTIIRKVGHQKIMKKPQLWVPINKSSKFPKWKSNHWQLRKSINSKLAQISWVKLWNNRRLELLKLRQGYKILIIMRGELTLE